MIVLVLVIAALATGITIAGIILAGRQSEERRPGYITAQLGQAPARACTPAPDVYLELSRSADGSAVSVGVKASVAWELDRAGLAKLFQRHMVGASRRDAYAWADKQLRAPQRCARRRRCRVSCEHLDFHAYVDVARIVEHLEPADEGRAPAPGDDPVAFRATVRVECAECGAALGFRVPDVGDLPDRPACSPDALELRLPLISPAELELLGPLAAMRSSDGLTGFSVRRGDAA